MTDAPVTTRLAQFIAAPPALPATVDHAARRHLLDTLGAILSGCDLPAGQFARAEVAGTGGQAQATVAGLRGRFPAVLAAYANAMSAHADETDDSHAPSLTHPGCAVVPAALALAELTDAPDQALLSAVAVGYDLCARIGVAMGGADFITERGFDTHAFGGVFGACAAAALLGRLDPRQCETALSLTAHQAGGLATLFRDRQHVEKAFVFAGMPARNGTWAALAARNGLVGVAGALDGMPGFFGAYGVDPGPVAEGLGESWAITATNIKRWCVGSPIQAALDAVELLMRRHGVTAAGVAAVAVDLSLSGAKVTDRREMPAVNLQHLVALMLVDGTVTFASSHDADRMTDPVVRDLAARVTLRGSEALTRAEPSRQAIVTLHLHDGRSLIHHATDVRGTAQNPMTDDELVAKIDGLLPGRGADLARVVLTGNGLVAAFRRLA